MKYALMAFLVAMLSGCGTLTSLSQRNGEYYLATTFDVAGIKATFRHDPWNWLADPIIRPFAIGIFAIDLPLSVVADTLLMPYDYIKGRWSGFTIFAHDDEGRPVPGVHVSGYFYRSFAGTTAADGTLKVNRTPGSMSGLAVERKGYYKTSQYMDRRGYIHNYLQKNQTKIYPILIREIKNPTAMYEKRASVDLPSQEGSYAYDLMAGALVAPHGTGKVADFIFHVQSTNRGTRVTFLELDISFASPDDGIQRFDFSGDIMDYTPQSTYAFPYLAPTSGYCSTLSAADDAVSIGLDDRARWEKRAKQANYIFKVRSTSANDGLYGRVVGTFKADIRGASTPNISFVYFLNPEGTRHLERARNTYLIEGLTSGEFIREFPL